jgi:outer membrane biosynthesis protein TonB
MEYSKIIAVTGLPGLYELVSSKTDGAVVKSLEDQTTRFVASRVHNFSHLESIEVYTVRDNVNLATVLLAMDKQNLSLPNAKDNDAVKQYFKTAYPDMDFDRVYTSDMKKMLKWFEILKQKNIEIKISEPVEEEAPALKEEEKATPPVATKKEKEVKSTAVEKPALKTPAKKEKPTEEKIAPATAKKTKSEEEENPNRKIAAAAAKEKKETTPPAAKKKTADKEDKKADSKKKK